MTLVINTLYENISQVYYEVEKICIKTKTLYKLSSTKSKALLMLII